MALESAIIVIVILIFSAVMHEVAHGVMAEKLGDPTAREAGRLTLNPIPHIDLFGSILLPGFLILAGSPIVFGAAKPVPVNFANLRHPKRDMVLVALAGPASNFILAALFALFLRFIPNGAINALAGNFLLQVVVLNFVLFIFNLIPIPPLDGSKVLAGLLADRFVPFLLSLERYGFLLVILFLYTGLLNLILVPALNFFLKVFLGQSLY
jgi:Zn-dependent protease